MPERIGSSIPQFTLNSGVEKTTFKKDIQKAVEDNKISKEEFQGLAKSISGGEQKLATILKDLNVNADIESVFNDGGQIQINDEIKEALLSAEPMEVSVSPEPEEPKLISPKPAPEKVSGPADSPKPVSRPIVRLRKDQDSFWDKTPFRDKTHVQFTNESPKFQELVAKAKELATNKETGFFGGKITKKEYKMLEDIAKKDGTITHTEKLFLEAMKNSGNAKNLASPDFNTKDFTMKVDRDSVGGDASPIENTSSNKNEFVQKIFGGNPMDAKINDKQYDKDIDDIDDKFIFKDFTASDVKQKVLDSCTGDKAALKPFAEALMEKMPDDKEAFTYINRLINREPPVSPETMEKVLTKFSSMMDTDYDSRVGNSRDLVVSALHDLALPSNIDQVGVGTCSGTCIQIEMAIKEPEIYLDMLDTLAKNEPFTTKTGAVIPPNWTFDNEGKQGKHDSRRSISSKIMQNSIMDFADVHHDPKTGDFNHKKNLTDNRKFDSSSNNKILNGGLYDPEASYAKNAIFGERTVVYDTSDKAKLMDILQKAEPGRANPIQISLDFDKKGSRDSSHAINIIGIDNDKNEVTYINPWGREETIPKSLLEKRITGVIAREGLVTERSSTGE